MSDCKTVRLGDVATYINGYAFKPSDWGTEGLPIIRIQNLTGNDYETNFYNGKIPEKYFVKNGDVLISWSASLGVYEWKKNDALLNQHIFKVVFDKLEVDKKYFMFTVSNLLNAMSKQTHGSTMRHITKPDFDNMPFPLPPIEKQKQIARKLDKCNELILKNNRILEKYDLLIKSRFIEMFGDPVQNSKGYKYKKLEELGKWESGGTPSRKNNDYFKGSIPWYSAGELNSLYLYDSNEKITETAIEESSAKLFRKGSLFVGMYDTAAFKMGIATTDCSSNQACANIFPNRDVNVIWLYYELMEMKEFFLQNRRGVRQKNLSLGMIKGFEIPYAPSNLQNDFAAFVQQIDKSKFAVQKSLEKAETLYKSLMQEYFG